MLYKAHKYYDRVTFWEPLLRYGISDISRVYAANGICLLPIVYFTDNHYYVKEDITAEKLAKTIKILRTICQSG